MDVERLDANIRRGVQVAAENRHDNSLETTLKRITSRRRVGKLDPYGEPEGLITDPKHFHESYHGSTEIICKDIAEILCKRYPDWLWAIQPQEFGRVINIFNLHLHTEFGYTIRMKDIMDDPKRKQAVAAGHDILRRFKMPDRFSAGAVREMPRDARGNGIPDISDFKNRKMIRDTEIARKLDSGEWMIVEANGMRYLRARA